MAKKGKDDQEVEDQDIEEKETKKDKKSKKKSKKEEEEEDSDNDKKKDKGKKGKDKMGSGIIAYNTTKAAARAYGDLDDYLELVLGKLERVERSYERLLSAGRG